MNTSIPLQEVKELLGDDDCIYFETGVILYHNSCRREAPYCLGIQGQEWQYDI